jgi:hypothetical protein
MFISYDADILHRNDAQTWSTKHIEIVRPAVKQYIIDDKTSTITYYCKKNKRNC